MQALAALTELEAINIMLGTIGEAPVNTLAATETLTDISIAQQVLREVTIAVLDTGWHFNTEINWPLPPTVPSKEIALPANCLRVDTAARSKQFDVVQRGTRLYDRGNRTYAFPTTIYVTMVLLLPFAEIPQAARSYITIRAARIFQARSVGSQLLAAFTEADENTARAALRRADSNNADNNILTGNWSVARVLQR